MMETTENWKVVPGYEGRYEVSDLGRVRNVLTGRMLKPWPNGKGGYLQVSLHVDKVRGTFTVHRLVLEAFIGLPLPGQECRHSNADRKDNRLENLSWGTHTENEKDKLVHGTRPMGDNHFWSVLTEADVRRIREDRRPLKSVAADYGVHFATISAVRLRKSWRHV